MNRNGNVSFPFISSARDLLTTLSPLMPLLALFTITCTSMNKDILPEKPGMWTVATDTLYTPDNLYDYIDGGAELYLSYGFRNVHSRVYSSEGQPDITVDLFDMNTPKDAYGVFMFSSEGVSDLVGQGTMYNEGFLLFWMDHYFVSIMAYPETPESKDAIMKIARMIEKAIGKTGELPAILDYLPDSGLDRESVPNFHNYAWMNTYCYISGENILQIDDETGALLARYGNGYGGSVLLCIEYPTADKAGKAYENFIANYLPELRGHRSLRVEDGTWSGIDRLNNYLILVFNAPGEAEIDGLTGLVKKKMEAEIH